MRISLFHEERYEAIRLIKEQILNLWAMYDLLNFDSFVSI